MNSRLLPARPKWLPPRRLWKERLRLAWEDYCRTGARWSHLAILGLVVAAVFVNLFLPHGWTAWPIVLAAAILIAMHEAAERNGQGVPPLHVYVWFVGAMIVWFVIVLLVSAVNPFVIFLGMGGLTYYGLREQLKHRARQRLIISRQTAGQCIHCGRLADPDQIYCLHCGKEADPDHTQRDRVANMPRSAADKARARANLTPAPPTSPARQKEQALLARRDPYRAKRK